MTGAGTKRKSGGLSGAILGGVLCPLKPVATVGGGEFERLIANIRSR